MLSKCVFGVFAHNVVDMALKTINESKFGLTHIFYFVLFACDTIHQLPLLQSTLTLDECSLFIHLESVLKY